MRSWFAVYDSYRSKIPELYCLGASPAVTSWVGAVYDGDLFVVLYRHLEATELGKRSPSYTAPTQLVTAGDLENCSQV